MAEDEATRLRLDLAKHERGRGRRYPEALKQRVREYTHTQRANGVSYADIADELAMNFETVRRWCVSSNADSVPSRASLLVPVEVVAEAPRGAVAIVSPSGFRLEGLEVAEALAALRALG